MSTGRSYMVPDYVPSVRANVAGARLIAPHWPYNQTLLDYVEREMASRDHCLIRAIQDNDEWYAIEGSHRIWTAGKLGVVVTIQPVGVDYLLQHDNPELGIVTAGSIIGVGTDVRGPVAAYQIVDGDE